MTPFDMAIAASGQTLYRVVTAKGAPLAAIPATHDQRKAMALAKAAAPSWPGCYVEEVEVQVRRRRVYQPRAVKRTDPFAIPSMPAVA